MESGTRVLCGIFVLLVSTCYLCGARANNRRDIRSTTDTTKTGASNKSRNGSNETASNPIVLYNISNVIQASEVLRIIMDATESNAVVHVRTEKNKVIKLNFTRKMLLLFNDLLKNRTVSRAQSGGRTVMPVTSPVDNEQLNKFKTATIALAVLCSIMFVALLFLTMCSRAKSKEETPNDTPLMVAKEPTESQYQSIRGLPRRETGNSYGYETVKPRLPPTRPSISYLLQPNESEYENLKLNELRTNVRESTVSNPYVPMNEALAGSVLTGSALNGSAEVLSGEDEDLYLTMKRLIRPEETAVQINDLGSI